MVENLYVCPEKVSNYRLSAVGTIKATDGTVITVPAVTAWQTHKGELPRAAELYNECARATPATSAEATIMLGKLPVVEIDPDGEVITGYLVADNYYEMWVNGKLVAVDAVPYTPFNSAIVRFKVKRPYTLAFKLVDWEENLGLGSELFQGAPWHPGDGGLVARFSDGTVTDSTWKAQSFYIGPLASPDDVVEKRGNVHDTTKFGRTHPLKTRPTCQDRCFAVHYPIPAGWETRAFDDTAWPRAFEYTDEEIGVTGLPAYTRYPELFNGSRWIWSQNLVFDNVVIARKVVR